MNKQSFNKISGFTLIELISVIVILGILAVGVSSFLKFGTQIYAETTTREKIISSARFAIERLNRELRNALPNSIRLTAASQCLEFTPILESTIYTDIPVLPEKATDKMRVIKFNEIFDEKWNAVVYPLNPEDVYDNIGKVHGVASIDEVGDEWIITLDNKVLFIEESPTQRMYFVNGTTEYCLQNRTLLRNGVPMAQGIDNSNPFDIVAATLQRNAIVQIHFRFEQYGEKITFNNEVQVLNVP